METKLDSRQGQFPASFPDTFKDFFAVMNEDEDHLELFSNLLEDKVIPCATRHSQRHRGGSLRCPNTNSSNVGRSNSFRVNRPTGNNSYCKHIKYCCLHQTHGSQNLVADFGYPRSKDKDERQMIGGNKITASQHNLKGSRSSLIERTFDCESCEESDAMSTTSSSTATIPYGSLNRHSVSGVSGNKGFLSKESRTVKQNQQQQSVKDISSGNKIVNSSAGSSSLGTNVNNSMMLSTSDIGGVGGRNNNLSGGRSTSTLYSDVSSGSSSMFSTQATMPKCFSDKLSCCPRPSSIRPPKSPNLNRRRSSSIAATLLTSDSKIFRAGEDTSAWTFNIPQSNTRERLSHVKSPVNSNKTTAGIHSTASSTLKNKFISESSGVLSFKQAMSGAVSPQYIGTPTSSVSFMNLPCTSNNSSNNIMVSGGGGGGSSGFTGLGGSGSAGGSRGCLNLTANSAQHGIATSGAITPTSSRLVNETIEEFFNGGNMKMTGRMGSMKSKQRMRTSSMPGESRKPRLADTRRAAIHCADMDIEYYRLRSFSITSHGICNLGDSLRSRRSRSINSVTSTGTSNSGRDRNNSNASRTSGDIIVEQQEKPAKGGGSGASIPAYKIAMLGSSGVGKTALTYQFTTSEYICAYDLSLDDDYGQKTVSVLLDGMETDLEIVDHPACEMSTEAFCSTYHIDLFVVVYSVVDRNSFKAAEKILQYLKENEMLLTRGAILVGNKTDLERHREVTRHNGRKLAKDIGCKFIETSSGLDHNVDVLLVGIVAQVKLNPQRILNLSEKERQRLRLNAVLQQQQQQQQQSKRNQLPLRKLLRQQSICTDKKGQTEYRRKQGSGPETSQATRNLSGERNASMGRQSLGPNKKLNKPILNLENILKVGESELDDDDDDNDKKNTVQSDSDGDDDDDDETTLDREESTVDDTISNESDGDGSNNSSDENGECKKDKENDDDNDGDGYRAYHVRREMQRKPKDQLDSSPKVRKPCVPERKRYSTIFSKSSDQNNQGKRNNESHSSLEESSKKTIAKLSNRTKTFLTSVLKFRKSLNVKRRSSGSCSDLFVI